MQVPLDIAFHDIPPSEAVREAIREKAQKLETYFNRITSCRVVVESPHRHQRKGRLYRVRIDLTVPGSEIVVGRDRHDRHAHEDVYMAIRDAFDAARRQLEDYVRRTRHEIKRHESSWSQGRVTKLFSEEGYGFITAPDGLEIYFHKNSVLDQGFDHLQIDSMVRYVQELGEKGPQASSVRLGSVS